MILEFEVTGSLLMGYLLKIMQFFGRLAQLLSPSKSIEHFPYVQRDD